MIRDAIARRIKSRFSVVGRRSNCNDYPTSRSGKSNQVHKSRCDDAYLGRWSLLLAWRGRRLQGVLGPVGCISHALKKNAPASEGTTFTIDGDSSQWIKRPPVQTKRACTCPLGRAPDTLVLSWRGNAHGNIATICSGERPNLTSGREGGGGMSSSAVRGGDDPSFGV
jgi:hypothetical protein